MTTRDELLQKLRIADLEYERDMLWFVCVVQLAVLVLALVAVMHGGLGCASAMGLSA